MQQRFLNGIRYIPTLPNILAKILALLNDPRSSARQLEEIITHDQALSTKVLTIANSAYYGFRHEILTVRRAVVALGYEEIRNICLGASLMGFLHPSTFRDRQQAELLWLHSLAAAEGARLVAESVSFDLEPEVAFTAGLIHDLGKVVLAAFFPEEIDAVLELMEAQGLSFRQAEQAQGVEHTEVGQALCQKWDLPPQLVEAVGKHHDPRATLGFPQLTAVVHVADFLARQGVMGHSINPDPPQVQVKALELLEVEERSLERWHQELMSRREAVIALWQTLLRE